MALVNRFTSKEKELDKEDTLKMLKDGISQAEIARQLGRSAQYISNLKNHLIELGLITQSEIDIARKNMQIQNQANKKTINHRLVKKEELKSKVLQGLKNKKTAIELMHALDIPSTTIKRYIKELIAEGKIEDSDIVKQKDKNKELAQIRNASILADIESKKYSFSEIASKYHVSDTLVSAIAQNKYEDLVTASSGKKKVKKAFVFNENATLTPNEKTILEWLHKGYPYKFIASEVGISQTELVKIINTLKSIGVIDSAQIQEAREQKRINDEEEILNYLKAGLSQSDILDEKKELTVATLSRMVSKLKQEKRITDWEIDYGQAYNADKINLEKLVLAGIYDGLTVKQIINSDDSRICY